MRPGDVVYHKPTGETWVLAGVNEKEGTVVPKGYPFPAIAQISDCELLRSGTGEQDESSREAFRTLGMVSFIEPDLPFCEVADADDLSDGDLDTWISMEDRQPEREDLYEVIRKTRGGSVLEEVCMWSKGKWHNAKGNVISTVMQWRDRDGR